MFLFEPEGARQAALLKPSGHVVHADVVNMFIKKNGVCPITVRAGQPWHARAVNKRARFDRTNLAG
jgi:hypothetical protein